MNQENKKGLRYNSGKLRYDLLHPKATEGIVKVLTKGAEKYEPHNWEKGMEWSTVLASLKRHLAAFESGEDYDQESLELHVDHIQCNAHFLSAYYKIAPQYDDRQLPYQKNLKIGLDIDEVLADWITAWCEYWGIENRPECWFFDRQIGEKFNQMESDKTLNDFYSSLNPLISPNEIPFEPHCYITSRPVPKEITEQWLDKHGFPSRPVYTVGLGKSKIQVAKESGIDIFVDDRFDNFRELNQNGICCYLYDTPHNRRYNVGYRRIKHLKELV